jgi:hypothetical protein
MPSSGMLRRVDLVRTDVYEELSASIIRVTRIGQLGRTLVVTSNRRTWFPLLTEGDTYQATRNRLPVKETRVMGARWVPDTKTD